MRPYWRTSYATNSAESHCRVKFRSSLLTLVRLLNVAWFCLFTKKIGEALFPPLPPFVHSLDEFRRMLLDLVARSFAALLQNVFIALRPLLLSSILEKKEGGRGPGPLRAMGAMTELFSQLLQGFQETFLYLPLAQRLFEQVFAYVNCTLFNEILLRRELCSFTKGADVKLNLRLFEEWLGAQGAAWVGKAPEQLRQVHQTINVLMLGMRITSVVHFVLISIR